MSFAYVPKLMFKFRVCLGVLSWNSQRGLIVNCYLQLFCVGFNSMPNLIVILFNHFFLYLCGVFFIVRVECEKV